MSRQSKNHQRRILAAAITKLHLDGKRGPTPPGGTFGYAGRLARAARGGQKRAAA